MLKGRANLKEVWRVIKDARLWTLEVIGDMAPADAAFLYGLVKNKSPSWYCDAAEPIKQLIEAYWDVMMWEPKSVTGA